MNEFLTAKDMIIERDEQGELIAEEYTLRTNNKDKVLIKPIPRGTIKKYFGAEGKNIEDLDGEILINYCVNPVFTSKNINYVKPYLVTAIVNAVLELSGLKEKVIVNVESTLKKKSIKKDMEN